MESFDNPLYTKLTIANLEYADESGMLDKYRATDGAPPTWKLVFSRYTIKQLKLAKIDIINRGDSELLAWVDPFTHELIMNWLSSKYGGLDLGEYILKINGG